jgi:uncharacterized membrane protein YvbJ
MVYCTKCGAQNEEDASVCVNCGALLESPPPRRRDWERDLERGAEEFGARAEQASELMGWRIDFGPLAIIVVGILIVAGVLYKQSQNRS